MAKYVLLEFESDADADKLIGAIDIWSSRLSELLEEDFEEPKVVAEFKKPTQFCTCTPEKRATKTGQKGTKYGFYVCGVCKKPAKNGGQVIWNLLEAELPPWKKHFQLQVRAVY